jgi:type II secretory pathway component GspD/PulD (secretin)
MSNRKLIPLALSAAVIAVVSVGFVPRVHAQTETPQAAFGQTNIPSLEFQNTDVRQCVRALFKQMGSSHYSIAPEVLGTVTISARNVSFDRALKVILGQVYSSFKMNDGAYEITKDPLHASNQNISSIEFQQADVRECIRSLCQKAQVPYSIAPDVEGTVTLSLKNVPFENVLKNMLRQVDATYRLESCSYEITKLKVPAPVSQMPQIGLGQPGATITQDSKFLYLYTNNSMYKIQKSDLKVVRTQELSLYAGRPGSWNYSGR